MQESEIFIPGPAGQLQAVVSQPIGSDRCICSIICHPHPLFGGTMTNKVVTTLAKAFRNLGAVAVRFNFRGVLRSAGHYDAGKGEVEDLLSVIAWSQKEYPGYEVWLAGFSFGAYVAISAAMQQVPAKLVVVAPPIKNFNMSPLIGVPCPWWLVQGERDEVVAAELVIKWGQACEPMPTLLHFPNAGHFFHGELQTLRESLEQALG